MLKDYVLGTEVAEKGDFHIANISMLLKNFGLIEGVDYLKYKGVTLLNKKSLVLPKYIRDVMMRKDLTDLSEFLPFTLFSDLLEGNLRLIKDKFTVIRIKDKQFVKFKDKEFRELLLNEDIIKCVVDNSEIKALVNEGFILGYLKLSNRKSLCWY